MSVECRPPTNWYKQDPSATPLQLVQAFALPPRDLMRRLKLRRVEEMGAAFDARAASTLLSKGPRR